ncbi:hypothetical protein [Acinetobacter nematophilus]|uniref:Uncharacterized protein n=1 Tax=Acinetobacter nematophilus TaxID=2994642 RepID=A0A9X3DV81_9GAMM|nr:hypothetical protein [Acinetobacter nematophilus]MCX5468447.1 hypothetical protein [Acinetobacter nematophilus]
MNFIKVSIIATVLSVWLPVAQAEEVASLPTIKVMADSELRQEAVGVTPYQEDKAVRKALQHQVIKKENELQNYAIGDNIAVVDIQPKATEPNFNQIPSALLREYVLAVASGLQSSDPTTGLFTMMEPLSMGMNRDKALEAVRNGTFKLNIDTDRLNLMLGDKWQSGLPK